MIGEIMMEFEMSKEELDELMENLSQILEEIEQYIIDNNSYNI